MDNDQASEKDLNATFQPAVWKFILVSVAVAGMVTSLSMFLDRKIGVGGDWIWLVIMAVFAAFLLPLLSRRVKSWLWYYTPLPVSRGRLRFHELAVSALVRKLENDETLKNS